MQSTAFGRPSTATSPRADRPGRRPKRPPTPLAWRLTATRRVRPRSSTSCKLNATPMPPMWRVSSPTPTWRTRATSCGWRRESILSQPPNDVRGFVRLDESSSPPLALPMKTSPLAGKPAPLSMLANVPRLVTAYFSEVPDPTVPEQRVIFGTSGHRGSSLKRSFNEWHILAITQAICEHRLRQGIGGPLFVGIDTHALSVPAFASALEVLAANAVQVMISERDEYTPTPAVSHAILTYNRGRTSGLADGIVITPSHNPPEDGGFKYNPPHGGPAETRATGWIQDRANAILEGDLDQVRRVPYRRARRAGTIHDHDYVGAYVADLPNVVDLDTVRESGVRIGVDPLGGASVAY